LKDLAASRSSVSSKAIDTSTTAEEPLTIPWTIVNRYYSAEVHFSVRTVEGLASSPGLLATSAPALVYVWVEGEVSSFSYLLLFILWHILLDVDS